MITAPALPAPGPSRGRSARPRPREVAKRCSGFTLIETVIVIAILLVIMVAVGSYADSVFAASSESTVMLVMNTEASRIVDRLTEEVRYARLDSLVPSTPQNAASVSFDRVTGWDGSAAIAGTASTISFQDHKVTIDDRVIADRVEELSFTLDGDVLTFTVVLHRTITVAGNTRTLVERLVGRVRLQTPE